MIVETITGFETQENVKIVDEPKHKAVSESLIFDIPSFHLLTQFVGYGKYINRANGKIFLRGQTSIYTGGLIPSLFRNIDSGSKEKGARKKRSKFGQMKKEILSPTKHFSLMEPDIVDPLLQHYGIKTHWLDVVDNLWIALWFASHSFKTVIANNRHFVHVEPKHEDEYGYVYLVCSDAFSFKNDSPGIMYGKETKLVDLRTAISSIYLRPHAQHAHMLTKNDESEWNYNSQIVGIARIKIKHIFDWIGQTGLMSVQSLFPPAYFDKGYQQLLDEIVVSKDFVKNSGSIQVVSY